MDDAKAKKVALKVLCEAGIVDKNGKIKKINNRGEFFGWQYYIDVFNNGFSKL